MHGLEILLAFVFSLAAIANGHLETKFYFGKFPSDFQWGISGFETFTHTGTFTRF